jgi:hypothetical protein
MGTMDWLAMPPDGVKRENPKKNFIFCHFPECFGAAKNAS